MFENFFSSIIASQQFLKVGCHCEIIFNLLKHFMFLLTTVYINANEEAMPVTLKSKLCGECFFPVSWFFFEAVL